MRTAGTLHWDVLGLYAGVLDGLRAAGRDAGRLDGIGIDSWAVDYGLLDADGALLGNPVHYRDARHATRGRRPCTPSSRPGRAVPGQRPAAPAVQHRLPARRPARAPPSSTAARRLLLVPDLLAHWLTGAVGAEVTNASTTGPARRRHAGSGAGTLIDRLGLPRRLFPPLTRSPATGWASCATTSSPRPA